MVPYRSVSRGSGVERIDLRTTISWWPLALALPLALSLALSSVLFPYTCKFEPTYPDSDSGVMACIQVPAVKANALLVRLFSGAFAATGLALFLLSVVRRRGSVVVIDKSKGLLTVAGREVLLTEPPKLARGDDILLFVGRAPPTLLTATSAPEVALERLRHALATLNDRPEPGAFVDETKAVVPRSLQRKLALGGALALAGGGVAYLLWPDSVTTPREPPIAITALHTADLTRGGRAIAPPPFTGKVERFDVVANIEWANSIAGAWWPDAELTLMRASQVGMDGTADLTAGGIASWDYVSRACIDDHDKRTGTKEPWKTNCRLMVRLSQDGSHVMSWFLTNDWVEDKTIGKPPCSLSAVLARALKDNKVASGSSRYSVMLEQRVPHGYHWSVIGDRTSADIQAEFCRGVPP